MLVVRGIEISQINIGNVFGRLIRVFLKNFIVTLKFAEHRRRKRDVSGNAQERIRAAPPELAYSCVPVLIKPFENTGGVRMNRRLTEQRCKKEVPIFIRNRVNQPAIIINPAGIVLRIENSVFFGYGLLVPGGVHILNKPEWKRLGQDPFIQVVHTFLQKLLINFGAVGKKTAPCNSRVVFEIVRCDVRRMSLEKTRHNAGTAEHVETAKLADTAPVLDIFDRVPDLTQERALIADIGDELPRQVVGALRNGNFAPQHHLPGFTGLDVACGTSAHGAEASLSLANYRPQLVGFSSIHFRAAPQNLLAAFIIAFTGNSLQEDTGSAGAVKSAIISPVRKSTAITPKSQIFRTWRATK